MPWGAGAGGGVVGGEPGARVGHSMHARRRLVTAEHACGPRSPLRLLDSASLSRTAHHPHRAAPHADGVPRPLGQHQRCDRAHAQGRRCHRGAHDAAAERAPQPSPILQVRSCRKAAAAEGRHGWGWRGRRRGAGRCRPLARGGAKAGGPRVTGTARGRLLRPGGRRERLLAVRMRRGAGCTGHGCERPWASLLPRHHHCRRPKP